MTYYNLIKVFLFGWFILSSVSVHAQDISISLEQAIAFAQENSFKLEQGRLSVDQQNQLADAGLRAQLTQLSISSEEFDLGDQSGIHSANVQQSFYLPKAQKAYRQLYESGALVQEKILGLSNSELTKAVKLSYYQLQYAKQKRDLAEESVNLFKSFLEVTTSQLESGESGKMPQLSAKVKLGQAKLEQEHSTEEYQIALLLFNQWLQTDTVYNVAGTLRVNQGDIEAADLGNNPHVQIIMAQHEQSKASVEYEKSKLLPQINTGFRLQTANSNFPLFGFSVGANIPLFKKSYQGRIEAAQIGVQVQEAALNDQRQRISRNIDALRFRMEHHIHILNYLEKELEPLVNEQRDVNFEAYREGIIGYLEYLNGLEQVAKVKEQYLTTIYDLNRLSAEHEYWLGQ